MTPLGMKVGNEIENFKHVAEELKHCGDDLSGSGT
jgi:hypothetical protein